MQSQPPVLPTYVRSKYGPLVQSKQPFPRMESQVDINPLLSPNQMLNRILGIELFGMMSHVFSYFDCSFCSGCGVSQPEHDVYRPIDDISYHLDHSSFLESIGLVNAHSIYSRPNSDSSRMVSGSQAISEHTSFGGKTVWSSW